MQSGVRLVSRAVSAIFVLFGLLVSTGGTETTISPSFAPSRLETTVGDGIISGRVVPPPGGHPALRLFLENLATDVVIVVPLDDAQTDYSVSVPAGSYLAYAWLPSFVSLGGHTVCGENPSCADSTLLPVSVAAGETVEDVDITDWHVPEDPLRAFSGRVIDGTGAEPITDCVVVTWRRHIMAVGRRSELPLPASVERYDLPGTTILPGFINTHVHNSYRRDTLQAWATAGVTTVRDVGAPVYLRWDSLRTNFESDPHNARILASGPLVTCPGGYPIAGSNFPSLTVSSEEEARQEITSLIDRGAEVIKIVIESGTGEFLSVGLATVIVDTAHARGIPVTVHLTRERDLMRALDAGVDDIAHMVLDYVPDSVIQRMVDDGTAWVPTLDPLNGHGTQMFHNLSRFVAAGGKVALGNDGGYLPGIEVGMPMAEIEWMAFAGMTPMQIIVAATSDAAAVCHREDLLGTLATGKLADILVVEGDPLNDLGTLRRPRLVVHEGALIRNNPPAVRRATRRVRPR